MLFFPQIATNDHLLWRICTLVCLWVCYICCSVFNSPLSCGNSLLKNGNPLCHYSKRHKLPAFCSENLFHSGCMYRCTCWSVLSFQQQTPTKDRCVYLLIRSASNWTIACFLQLEKAKWNHSLSVHFTGFIWKLLWQQIICIVTSLPLPYAAAVFHRSWPYWGGRTSQDGSNTQDVFHNVLALTTKDRVCCPSIILWYISNILIRE